MRGLKYRAWIPARKEILPVAQLSFKDGRIDGVGVEKHGIVTHYVGSNIVVSICTGLRDKNGVEVYEGDILRETIRDLDADSGTATRIRPVTWGTEFAGFNVGEAPHWSVLNPIDLQRMEVIGNIYENPDVLN